MQNLQIRSVEMEDAQDLCAIYNPFITGTNITFEETPIDTLEMKRRIARVHEETLPWLCAEVNHKLAGYAYATQWRERSAYRFTVESTIYLSPEYAGKGLGENLYSVLLERIQAAGKRNVIAVITLPNPASIALHEKLGFIKTAHFPEVGFKFNRWLDVGYWQLSFSMDPDQSSPLDEKPTS